MPIILTEERAIIELQKKMGALEARLYKITSGISESKLHALIKQMKTCIEIAEECRQLKKDFRI